MKLETSRYGVPGMRREPYGVELLRAWCVKNGIRITEMRRERRRRKTDLGVPRASGDEPADLAAASGARSMAEIAGG